MPILPTKMRGDVTFPQNGTGFVLEEDVAVNKHGHDSVEVLPVPIKQQRDHPNERWPWHNWDSSQRKPGGWSDREGSEWGGGGGLKTQHKYYFHFMGEQPTVGWAAGPESQCQWRYFFRRGEQAYRQLRSSLPVFYFCRRHMCNMIKKEKKRKRGALHMDAEKGPDLEWCVPSLVEITNWLHVRKHMFWPPRRTMTALRHVLTCVKQHGTAQC